MAGNMQLARAIYTTRIHKVLMKIACAPAGRRRGVTRQHSCVAVVEGGALRASLVSSLLMRTERLVWLRRCPAFL